MGNNWERVYTLSDEQVGSAFKNTKNAFFCLSEESGATGGAAGDVRGEGGGARGNTSPGLALVGYIHTGCSANVDPHKFFKSPALYEI